MDYSENFLPAIVLTAAAGLATTLGSLLGLAVKKPGASFMGFTLGFSAGVMILVSFIELLPDSIERLGFPAATAAFLIGMAGFLLIDFFVPHDYIGQHDHPDASTGRMSELERTGMLVALGMALHNLPEGMVTFAGALEDIRLGAAIAVAVAIHNIPEGIAVSAPVYAATGNRRKAFLWSFLSGASEPAGAALAGLILMPFLSPVVLGWTLAIVAGIMVAISLDELVPIAKSYDVEHVPIVGIIMGMAVMALSLHLLK